MALNPIMLEGESRAQLRRQMIKDALQEKNPALFQELKKAKKLDRFLKDREKEMIGVFRQESSRVLDKHASVKNHIKNPLEWEKAYEADLRSQWEGILATYLEF